MKHPFSRLVARVDCLDDEHHLAAYARDRSGLVARPLCVLRPRNEEQLRRILLAAQQYRIPVVPRGLGSGRRAGAIAERACILHLHHFHSIALAGRYADVGAGASVERLNGVAQKQGLIWPFPGGSLGAQVVLDPASPAAFRYGRVAEHLLSIEVFDGLGRRQRLAGERMTKVIGKEGTTGVVTRVRLRLEPAKPVRSLEFTSLDRVEEVLTEAVLFVEYVDDRAARALGRHSGVIVGYTNYDGTYQNPVMVERLLSRYERLPEQLATEGLRVLNDATLTRPQVPRFLELCAARGAACFGHLGIGVLVAAAKQSLADDILAMGAQNGGKYGFGRTRAAYVPHELKSAVRRLKEERDYHSILNPGVL